jgi:DNA-binding transcriptional LysR family regulator
VDLVQLEHFLGVVEERSFTRAAERVGRTQPAVSQSIKKLEDEIGALLFVRDLHDVSLTHAGRILVDYARKMVHARDTAMRDVAALKTVKTGKLNIAAHESAAVYLLPAALQTYLGRFPGVNVGIARTRLADIPRQVLDREVDLGFVKDEPGFHGLKWVDVHLDEMILVAAPGHPLVGRDNVRIRDLGNEQFVLHHLCSATEQTIRQLFEQHATRCRIVAELFSFENIKSFAQAEVGVAIVPRITVAAELREGRLAHIPVSELRISRRTLMIHRDQGYLSESARDLIAIVRRFNWDHQIGPASQRAPLQRHA